MKKSFLMSLLILAMGVLLTACGTKDVPVMPDGSEIEGNDNFVDADASSDYVSEKDSDESEYIEIKDDEPYEAATEDYSGRSYDSFWQGDDYFDLEGYLLSIGAEDLMIYYTDETESRPYGAKYNLNNWRVEFSFVSDSIISMGGENMTIYIKFLQTEYLDKVQINQGDSVVIKECLECLPQAMEGLLSTEAYSEGCPFCDITKTDERMLDIYYVSEEPFIHTHNPI